MGEVPGDNQQFEIMRKNSKGMGGHQSAAPVSVRYITPKHVLAALGEFTLDPCMDVEQPWPTAQNGFTINEDGLKQEWFGRCWVNPPFGRWMTPFLKRLAEHGNGILLIPARTERVDFQQYVFGQAMSRLWLAKRLKFHRPGTGEIMPYNSGAPIVLAAYGEENVEWLEHASKKDLPGYHEVPDRTTFVIVGVSSTWKMILKSVITRAGGEAVVEEIYSMVKEFAPDKVGNNPNWKAKIRQQLRQHFSQSKRATYVTDKAAA